MGLKGWESSRVLPASFEDCIEDFRAELSRLSKGCGRGGGV